MTPFLLWCLDRLTERNPELSEAWAEVIVDMDQAGMWEVEIAWRIGALRIRKVK